MIKTISTTNTASLSQKLSAYLYFEGPERPEVEPVADLLFAKDLPIIPHEIFIKGIDIANTQEILRKAWVDNVFLDYFKHSPQPIFTLLINGYTPLNLNKISAQMIVDEIKKFPSDVLSKFSAITMDIEPVYDYVMKIDNVNLVIDIINQVNNDLNRPVSVYISPAKLGNAENGMANKAPEKFKQLMDAIKLNQKNCILLPAYVMDPVREDDIELSIKAIKEAAGWEYYKLIVDTRDYEKDGGPLKKRLEFIKTNQFDENGLCIYSVEIGQETNYPGTLDTIKTVIPDLIKNVSS